MKRRAEEAKKRYERTKLVLIKDKEIQQKKLDDYNLKQFEISERQKEIDKINQKKEEERNKKNEERAEHIKNTILKNEQILNHRKRETMDKIKEREKITNDVMEKKNMENQEKIEENYKKFLEKQKFIENLEKNKDLKRMKAEKEIDDKREKIEQFKKEQELILERKRQVRDDIIRKKEEYDYKFQKMFHRKNIDDKMIRNIQNMFPGNERINSLLNRLQELEEEEQNEMLKAEIKGKEIDDNLKKS